MAKPIHASLGIVRAASSAGEYSGGLRVEIISLPDALEGLREEWNGLAAAARRSSIFMTWEWQSCWWRHYGRGQAMRILLVRDGKLLIGLLPLYIQNGSVMGAVPLKVLRTIGTGGDTAPDYLEPLYRPGHEARVAHAMALKIFYELPGWHIAKFTDLWSDSPLAAALSGNRVPFGTRIRSREGQQISLATLPGSWEEYLGSFSRDRRWTIRHARRRFMKEPGSRFFIWDGAHTLDAAMDRLMELHKLRWNGRAQQHAFLSREYVGFHRGVMRALFEEKLLRLYALEMAGSVVAMLYCFRYRDGIYYFQGGFDPALGKLSPGAVLFGFAIESAIAEGCTVFDMLRGQYEYKTYWSNGFHRMKEVELCRPGLAGCFYRFRHEVVPRWRSSFKAMAGA